MRPSKKSAIVEAAMRVAEEQGLSAVTIDAVAEQAGITKGACCITSRAGRHC